MRVNPIAIFPLLFACVACDVYWGFFQQGGTTKLFGSSFGLLGKDATYDYVVGNLLLIFCSLL